MSKPKRLSKTSKLYQSDMNRLVLSSSTTEIGAGELPFKRIRNRSAQQIL